MTGSRERQKRDEFAQFKRFSAVCTSVPPCATQQPGEPEPDIVLDCAAGLIGIELTDLLTSGDTTQRGRESERVNLLERAKLLYAQGGYPPAHVYVAWCVEPRLGKGVRAAQAQRLCELVVRHQPRGTYGTELGSGFDRIIESLPITFLQTWSARSHEQSDWREAEAHEVKPLGAADLQARVELEEPKLGKYRASYESVWLVLVVDAGGPSTWATVLDEVWHTTFDSRYDRVFLLDWMRERCGELRLRSRPLRNETLRERNFAVEVEVSRRPTSHRFAHTLIAHGAHDETTGSPIRDARRASHSLWIPESANVQSRDLSPFNDAEAAATFLGDRLAEPPELRESLIT